MVFCGQCGFHLPAGVTRCPRCGTVANTPTDGSSDQFSTDAPTVASLTYTQPPQASGYPGEARPSPTLDPRDQQKIVLNPENNRYGYNPATDDEPTSAMKPADYRTRPQGPVEYNTNAPYSTTPSQPSQTPYPSQAGGTSSNSGYPQTYVTSSANLPSGGASPYRQQPTPPIQQSKSRSWPLLFALLILLVIFSAIGVFVVRQLHARQITSGTTGTTSRSTGTASGKATGGTGVVSTVVVTPINAAKQVVQDYYADVNNKDYQDAYNLRIWESNSPSYTTFKNGYTNTVYDMLTIQSATRLSDGTVKVILTIVATERNGSGTQQHTYTGYYIVGQHEGTWKILSGVFSQSQ